MRLLGEESGGRSKDVYSTITLRVCLRLGMVDVNATLTASGWRPTRLVVDLKPGRA